MSRRDPAEIARAIRRLRHEEQVPLADLAGLHLQAGGEVLRPTAAVLLRWGTQARRGVWLDVLWCRTRGCWVTSRAALERFAKGVGERGERERGRAG